MDLKIFSGKNNRLFAQKMCQKIGVPSGVIDIHPFSDGEERVRFEENLRGADVFLVQSTNQPTNNLFQLLQMVDAAQRASAERITVVIPYFGWARQERKDRSRVPITAKLVAKLIEAAGADRLLTMDLHAKAIEGFFEIPVDHIYIRPLFVKQFSEFKNSPNVVAIAADAGGTERARAVADRLGLDLAHADKRRSLHDGKVEKIKIVGDIEPHQIALIVEDMIDTGGTLISVSRALKEQKGVENVLVCAPHAVLSGNGIEKLLTEEVIKKIYISDTIEQPPEKLALLRLDDPKSKFALVSSTDIFASAIGHIHHNSGSISQLFE